MEKKEIVCYYNRDNQKYPRSAQGTYTDVSFGNVYYYNDLFNIETNEKIGYFIQNVSNEQFNPSIKIRTIITDYVLYNTEDVSENNSEDVSENNSSQGSGSMRTVETRNLEYDSFPDYKNASNLCNYLRVLGNNCIVSVVQSDNPKIRNISFKFSF